jgi:hypothetical protein
MRQDDDGSLPLLSLNPSLINVITLGHKGLFNDLSYFWLLQKITHENKSPQDPDRIFRQIKLVTRHHPDIESVYTLSCFVMTLDFHQGNRCVDIADDGIKALPRNWMILAVVAYVFAFVLKDTVKASYYYKKTEGLPGSPAYLHELSDRLLKGAVEKKDGENALRSIIEGTKDEDYRDFLIKFLTKGKRH